MNTGMCDIEVAMFFNVLPLTLQCCKKCRGMSGMVGFSGVHTDPVNGQAKVLPGHCGTAETPNNCSKWSGVVMQKHSTTDVNVWNDVKLQDFVSISDACQCTCHMHKRNTYQ